MHHKEFNRNLIGGKRPNKGLTKLYGLSLSERLKVESTALTQYKKRVNQK